VVWQSRSPDAIQLKAFTALPKEAENKEAENKQAENKAGEKMKREEEGCRMSLQYNSQAYTRRA